MLKSMTGYGMAQGKVAAKRVIVEAKSVNHKFCEINLRLAPRYSILEGKIVEFGKSYFSRGRIDILVKEEFHGSSTAAAKIDLNKLKAYHRALKSAAKALKIQEDVRLDTLLDLPQVLIIEEDEDPETLWKQLRPLLKTAFLSLEKMKIREGDGIEEFFKHSLELLRKEVISIEKWVPKNIELHRGQLSERIQKLSNGIEVDPQRLAQEIAYFVDRSDISEELQRLTHHLAHFKEILQGKDPIGRKLDFLLQEINREVNTLSAKAQNAEISRRVVECKHTLEKMREQVQNVE
jgi:uncharacterized protein (TIGR00255 family)